MQREANTAGRLQEPHVVPIHDYGEIDGHLFIDMRFVEGTDVTEVLRRKGPLPPPRAVAIIRQVASALDAAHRAGSSTVTSSRRTSCSPVTTSPTLSTSASPPR